MRPPVFAFAALVCLTASLAVVPGASAAATSSQHRQAQNAHVPGHRTAHPTFRSIAASLQSARSATPAVAQAHAAIPKVDQAALDQRPAADGTVAVAITGDNRQVARRVTALGGQVLASTDRAVSAMIAPDRVGTLAADPAVSRVSRPERAYPTGVTSEGVGLSGATQWLSAGDTGTGQTIGIVDAGFANLSSEVAAGNLPAGQIVSSLPSGHGCTATQQNASQHGTAVAEIVHQMAPDAQLVLYCIQDTIGFADAETTLQAANVKIVTSSLGFAADSRGDGSGPAGSAAATVATARKAGILWIQSAGNNAQDHWSGRFRRDSASGLAELDGTAWEADGVFVAAGGGADLVVQWDQWPVSSSSVNLLAYGWQCTDTDCTHKVPIHPVAGHPDQASPVRRGHVSGQQPTVVIPVTNTAAFDQEWDVVVQIGTTTPAVGYELSYWGDVSPSNLAWYDSPSRAAAGSVSAPANSPYALAVGAADVSNQALEPFSSQGPTIDGRAKPDLVGWDGVSSNLSDFSTGFFGTSAAAPHVAGAAALVAGLHPNWDAAQLQNYLEQTASSGGPHNPPVNTTGHGLLTLGAPASSGLPVTSRYQELGSPVRILDTRPGQLPAGNKGPLGAKGTLTIPVPGLPVDATAVAINLTGTGVSATTFLSVFAGGTAWSGSSNLNLGRGQTAAVFAVSQLGAGGTVTIRNDAGTTYPIVDVVGYFGTAAETGKYAPLPANRVLDTRSGPGAGQLVAGQTIHVNPGAAAAGASAVVVNVTATRGQHPGVLSLSPDCSKTSSTLNYTTDTRANMAIVKPDGTGSICIAGSGGPVDVVLDVIGYFSPTASAEFVALPVPVRIADTRTGNAGRLGALGAAGEMSLYAAGIFDVPYGATALLTNVTGTAATRSTYLEVFPGTLRPSPDTSTLNLSAGQTVPNAAVANVSGHVFSVLNNAGTTQTIVDLFGYFI